jgi:segregation and condensation protein A
VAYDVHLDVYDGPFDLLLQLISAQEVDVYEVRLSDIVDAFCAEIARFETFNLEIATEFLLIAATLVELKCRRLLPGADDPDMDEELSLFEARDYLLARLVECKTFSGTASVFASMEQVASRSVARRAGPDERFEQVAPDLLAGVTPEDLARLVLGVFAEHPVLSVSNAHIHTDEVTVVELLAELMESLPTRPRVSFRELTADAPSTAHVVACFLALLELYKRELIALDQLNSFGEIRVRWTGNGAKEAPSFSIDDYDELESEASR